MGTLIRALLDRGHRVTGYTLDRSLLPGTRARAYGTDQFRLYYIPMRKRSIRPNGLSLGRIVDLYRMERRELAAAMRESGPDVVHAHWLYEFALAAIESGIPHVITAHDSPAKVLRYMPNLYRLGRYFMARKALRRARVLTTVSEYLRDEVRGYARAAVDVVANPLPLELCQRDAKRSIDPPGKMLKVGMVLNGWSRFKNQPPAIKGFSIFRQGNPHAELHLFGHDFEPGGKGFVWCKRHGFESGLSFHGPTAHDALLHMLAGIDVLLHPALEETFGMSVAEAMALGKPVIGGDRAGAIPWLLDFGAAGLLVDVRSPTAIAKALDSLALNADLRQNLAQAGFKRVSGICAPNAVVAAYEKSYLRAVTANPAVRN